MGWRRRLGAAAAALIWLTPMATLGQTTNPLLNCRENEFPTRERGCVPFESLTLAEIFGPEGMALDLPPDILALIYQEYGVTNPNFYQGARALPVRSLSTEASFQARVDEILAAGGQTVDTRLGDIPAFSNPSHLPDATVETALKQFYGPQSQNPRGNQPLGSIPPVHDLVTRGADPDVKAEMASVPLNQVPQEIRRRAQRDNRYAELLQNLAKKAGRELLRYTVRELGLEKMVPGITGMFEKALVGDWRGLINLAIQKFVDWAMNKVLSELGVSSLPVPIPFYLVGLAPANRTPTALLASADTAQVPPGVRELMTAFINHVGKDSLDCQCEGSRVEPGPIKEGARRFEEAAEAVVRVPFLPRDVLPRMRTNTACRDPQARGPLGAMTLFRGHSSTFAKTFGLGSCLDVTLSMEFSARPARDALSTRFCLKLQGKGKCRWLGQTARCAVPLRYTLPDTKIGQHGIVITSIASLINLVQNGGGRCGTPTAQLLPLPFVDACAFYPAF